MLFSCSSVIYLSIEKSSYTLYLAVKYQLIDNVIKQKTQVTFSSHYCTRHKGKKTPKN